MGLDSVEMVMQWEDSLGISMADYDLYRSMRTPRNAIDVIAGTLNARDDARRACLTLRAFHRLRKSMIMTAYVSRSSIRPGVRLKELLMTKRQRKQWNAIRTSCNMPDLPGPGLLANRTVGDLVLWMVANAAKELKHPGEPWTRSEIRTVVRAAITCVIGIDDFDDDDDFIDDLRVD